MFVDSRAQISVPKELFIFALKILGPKELYIFALKILGPKELYCTSSH